MPVCSRGILYPDDDGKQAFIKKNRMPPATFQEELENPGNWCILLQQFRDVKEIVKGAQSWQRGVYRGAPGSLDWQRTDAGSRNR
jgi:hypothetical protein